jgi:hypothetical protein
MVVTRAEVYEKVIFADRPMCPHCGREMRVWECFSTPFTCGSRWGSPYLYICANDQCPPFVDGWESMKKQYGRTFSYRCICYPDSRKTAMMMVYTHAEIKSGIIDEAVIASDKAKGTAEDPDVQELIRYFEAKDVNALVVALGDKKAHYKIRVKAAELLGEAGSGETIDFLSNYRFKDQRISAAVRKAIKRIHEINKTRECPFCSEIVPMGIAKCNQCGRELD